VTFVLLGLRCVSFLSYHVWLPTVCRDMLFCDSGVRVVRHLSYSVVRHATKWCANSRVYKVSRTRLPTSEHSSRITGIDSRLMRESRVSLSLRHERLYSNPQFPSTSQWSSTLNHKKRFSAHEERFFAARKERDESLPGPRVGPRTYSALLVEPVVVSVLATPAAWYLNPTRVDMRRSPVLTRSRRADAQCDVTAFFAPSG